VQDMICSGACGQHRFAAHLAILLFPLLSHHAHPLSTHISSRIGPATRQAFRSRAILRDGFMVERIVTELENVKCTGENTISKNLLRNILGAYCTVTSKVIHCVSVEPNANKTRSHSDAKTNPSRQGRSESPDTTDSCLRRSDRRSRQHRTGREVRGRTGPAKSREKQTDLVRRQASPKGLAFFVSPSREPFGRHTHQSLCGWVQPAIG